MDMRETLVYVEKRLSESISHTKKLQKQMVQMADKANRQVLMMHAMREIVREQLKKIINAGASQ